jgi:hypothetical protein
MNKGVRHSNSDTVHADFITVFSVYRNGVLEEVEVDEGREISEFQPHGWRNSAP